MPKIKEAVTHLLKGGKILIDIACGARAHPEKSGTSPE
jgi:hypothetical protein